MIEVWTQLNRMSHTQMIETYCSRGEKWENIDKFLLLIDDDRRFFWELITALVVDSSVSQHEEEFTRSEWKYLKFRERDEWLIKWNEWIFRLFPIQTICKISSTFICFKNSSHLMKAISHTLDGKYRAFYPVGWTLKASQFIRLLIIVITPPTNKCEKMKYFYPQVSFSYF